MEPLMQFFAPAAEHKPIQGRLRFLAIAAMGLISYSVIAPQTRAWTEYGADGTITKSEAVIVRGLITPGTEADASGYYPFAQAQSRHAITSRIGYERWADETTGRYEMGRGYADIVYDEKGRAIGVRQHLH
jgi:hypothetical protein